MRMNSTTSELGNGSEPKLPVHATDSTSRAVKQTNKHSTTDILGCRHLDLNPAICSLPSLHPTSGLTQTARLERARGAVLVKAATKPATTSAELVRDNWNAVKDFTSASQPTSQKESLLEVQGYVSGVQANKAPNKFNHKLALKYKHSRVQHYWKKDVLLYALSSGYSLAQPDAMRFVYENDPNFTVLPSFATQLLMYDPDSVIPGFPFDFTKILHAEHYVEVYKALAPSARVTTTSEIVDVLDKKHGAQALLNATAYDENGEKLAFAQAGVLLRGAGKFGGHLFSKHGFLSATIPKTKPDAEIVEELPRELASLYRLNGDLNPVHIDTDTCKKAGFGNTPILHGLCTFAYSFRHIMKTFADNDMTKFKAIKTVFSAITLPGNTLRTKMWKDGNKILFQTLVDETKSVCIDSAYIELHE